MKPLPMLVSLLTLLLASASVSADQPISPYRWITTSASGQFCFKMVPAKDLYEGDASRKNPNSFGVAYKLNEQGELVELWRGKGWYVFQGFLSDDGKTLVGLGADGCDQEGHNDLAIAIYTEGKLVKEYMVKDLLKDPAKVDQSVSHYRWRPSKQSVPTGYTGWGDEAKFHLVMLDKTAYDFDSHTGAIASTTVDREARSMLEMYEEEQAADGQKGRALFEACSAKQDILSLFSMTDTHSGAGSTLGVEFNHPEWHSHFMPLKPLEHKAMVEGVFPVIDGKLQIGLSAEQMLGALKAALAHPFVRDRFVSHNAEGIRMRPSGNRLHWETSELKEFLGNVKIPIPSDQELSDWAYIIVDEPGHEYTTLYLNVKTAEIMTEDKTKWPYQTIRIGPDGKRRKAEG